MACAAEASAASRSCTGHPNAIYRKEVTLAGQKDTLGKLVSELNKGGENEEGVARAVVDMRNQMRQDSWKLMDQQQVAKLQAEQMQKYGNPVGPVAEQQFSRYGSWAKVIEAAFRTNNHYDSMYNPNEPVVPFAPVWDDGD
jgi:hypothetical protein